VNRGGSATLMAVLGALVAAPGASAATLSVDDDGRDCPAASFARVQDAVDAAHPGDVVAICPGTYPEGSGAPGTNALTIAKSLTLKGAGADLVRITPRPPAGGRIADPADLDVRDGVGDLVSVVGTPVLPVTANIAGVTIDGEGTYSEAGVVYLDAQGSLTRSRITDVVTSESATTVEGGWRGPQPGYGVALLTRATARPANMQPRTLALNNVRVDRYNRAGVYVEGLPGSEAPLVDLRLSIDASEVVGRILCQNFAENGNCSAPGLVTTGTLFGQDGVRVGGQARASVTGSSITSNLTNGENAPVRQAFNAAGVETNPGTANNANLPLSAGIRLADADAANSLIERNNILDNGYGVINALADGTTANPVAVPAPMNYWGVRFTPPPVNNGPAISPAVNPPVPENPVNGAPVVTDDGTTSSAVDFLPFRSGPQSDPTSGQFPNIQAPQPVSDAAPAITLSAPATAARGSTIVLAANASDDFGVKAVAFYAGTDELGTADVPPYAITYTVPGDAPCTARTVTALAFDSAGQTAAANASFTVTGCPGPPDPPEPPAPPAGSLPTSLNSIPQAGRVVAIAPTAEAGVAKVEFVLGDRVVCTDTTAPYSCNVKPRLADVGLQSFRAVITDRIGQSTTLERQVLVRKFASRGIEIDIERKKVRGGVRRTITATVVPPAGETAAAACPDGSVTFVVERRLRDFINRQQTLRSDCTARMRFTARKAKKRIYQVEARFPGNTVLKPASKTRRFS